LLCYLFIFYTIGSQGLGSLNLDFLSQNPELGGKEGGIFSIIISTLYILALSIIFVLIIGQGISLRLFWHLRNKKKYKKLIFFFIDLLNCLPSIVFGLFGNIFFCEYLGLGYSILSGALTLSLMCLPFFIRSYLNGLELIPKKYILSSISLNLSLWTTYRTILFKENLPGLIGAISLSLARAAAETAALLFTSGYVDSTPSSPLDSGRTLSIHIYELSMNIAGADNKAYATTLVLCLIILTFNMIQKWAIKTKASAPS